MGRRERMKQGNGMDDREESSKGIEIRITDSFAINKPTTPFKFAEQLVVYYESLKRVLKTKTTYGYRWNESLKTNVEEKTYILLFIMNR